MHRGAVCACSQPHGCRGHPEYSLSAVQEQRSGNLCCTSYSCFYCFIEPSMMDRTTMMNPSILRFPTRTVLSSFPQLSSNRYKPQSCSLFCSNGIINIHQLSQPTVHLPPDTHSQSAISIFECKFVIVSSVPPFLPFP